MGGDVDVSVVVITRDRSDGLMASLSWLVTLVDIGEVAEVVVVGNGPTDQTLSEVRRRYPSVELLALRTMRAPGLAMPVPATSASGSVSWRSALWSSSSGVVDPTGDLMASSPLPSDLAVLACSTRSPGRLGRSTTGPPC